MYNDEFSIEERKAMHNRRNKNDQDYENRVEEIDEKLHELLGLDDD